LLSPQTLAVFSTLFQHLYLKLRGGHIQAYQSEDPFIWSVIALPDSRICTIGEREREREEWEDEIFK
jgi:hypothetical protein